MKNWKDLGSNIIKLEGYGLYVTYIDSKYYACEILPKTGHPPLDPDGCIDWDDLTEPPNQSFLNILNERFSTSVTMNDFGCSMSISEIKKLSAYQATQKKVYSDSNLQWLVKNIREREK